MNYSKHTTAFVLAIFFSWLFYSRQAGINILLFDVALTCALFLLSKEKLRNNRVKLFLAGTLASGLFTLFHSNSWVLFTHHLSLFLLGGALAAPELKSIVNIGLAGVLNIGISLKEYVQARQIKLPQNRPAYKFIHALRISVLPILAVLLFGTIYAHASPWFNTIWKNVNHFLTTVFGDFFAMISLPWFFTLLGGLFVTVYILFANSLLSIKNVEDDQPDNLVEKPLNNKELPRLQREKQIAILLFSGLNVLLLMQNILDIVHVWFGFEWDGQYLKQFVHEGTWLLIVSILLSALLLLAFFRGGLNFIAKNTLLKNLALAFIIQNIVLAGSVAVRNLWYISYFNLAFKRIGVFFFLLAVFYGLYTVFIKVKRQKSISFLVKQNGIAVYTILVTVGMVNWDTVIAKYNFAHADSAFVHLSFLSKLDNSALPFLVQPEEKLTRVKQDQNLNYGRDKYALSPQDYTYQINSRIKSFTKTYPKRHWLEWNFADWRAYRNLKQ